MIDKSKLYFIFNNDELLMKIGSEDISIPNENDINNLNINLTNVDSLVIKNNKEFLFAKTYKPSSNLSSEFQFFKLRSLISSMNEDLFNLAGKAYYLTKWTDTYKYCNRCGTLMENKNDERAKICPSCNFISYPRISPAIITAIIRDNKLLLAHNTNFPKKRYSVIAGFLEPGETFEDCVSREVWEETKIKVKNIKYFGSQPWPFPDSLMVAFTCEYENGELTVDGKEIDDASWYTVNEFPNIPFKGSIARKLIDWFADNYK